MKIVVAAAMERELRAFGFPASGGIGTGGVIVASSVLGVGPSEAAHAAREVARARPSIVLHIGYAGGLRAGVQAGHALLVTAVSRGVYAPRLSPALPDCVPLDDAWVSVVRRSLAHRPVRLAQGPLLTVDSFIDRAADKREIGLAGPYLACEMEAASLAAACRACDVPYLGVRVISDGVDDDVPPPPAEDGRPTVAALRRSARWLRSPWQWGDLPRALHNRGRADGCLRTIGPSLLVDLCAALRDARRAEPTT